MSKEHFDALLAGPSDTQHACTLDNRYTFTGMLAKNEHLAEVVTRVGEHKCRGRRQLIVQGQVTIFKGGINL
jgi:hypothetical protein